MGTQQENALRRIHLASAFFEKKRAATRYAAALFKRKRVRFLL
jgi:hypothetical protein